MARKRLGVVEGLYQTQMILAEKAKRPPVVPPDINPELMSPQGIRAVASGIAASDRIPDQVMLDTILRDYWRMEKPNKLAMLNQYRQRCGMKLPQHWQEHHVQMAAFLESILPVEVVR